MGWRGKGCEARRWIEYGVLLLYYALTAMVKPIYYCRGGLRFISAFAVSSN